MPFARTDTNSQIYWKLEGSLQKPTLVLLNSIGTDMALWDRTIPHLLNSFCILRLDTRGHGASTVLADDYSLATLADDVVAVMDAAGIKQAAIAGVSLGGMMAMELALRHRERVTALALICTSATIDTAGWTDRVEKVRSGGMASIVDLAMSRFLSPEYARSHESTAESLRLGLLGMSPDGYAGAAAAIRDMALIDRLPGLDIPTLVIVGDRDSSMPLSGHADRLVATIPGATLQHLSAGHLAPLEAPEEVARSLRRFLVQQPKTENAADTLFEAGLANRRRILGDEWVNRSLANRTSFNTDFQAMITRIAWQEIWGRDGLDDRTRRLLVIAITASLGRWEEFGLHVRSGLSRGGFTRDELKEVLMQTGIYAGVPAANTAFAEAGKIIAELEKASKDQTT